MIMLRIEDKPGALVSALEPFRKLGVNLVHFASRPAPEDATSNLFFVEADGHREDLEKTGLLAELVSVCSEVKVLGSYPKP
jgi:prephenate dehydratase